MTEKDEGRRERGFFFLFFVFLRERERMNLRQCNNLILKLVTRAEMWTLQTPPKLPEKSPIIVGIQGKKKKRESKKQDHN